MCRAKRDTRASPLLLILRFFPRSTGLCSRLEIIKKSLDSSRLQPLKRVDYDPVGPRELFEMVNQGLAPLSVAVHQISRQVRSGDRRETGEVEESIAEVFEALGHLRDERGNRDEGGESRGRVGVEEVGWDVEVVWDIEGGGAEHVEHEGSNVGDQGFEEVGEEGV